MHLGISLDKDFEDIFTKIRHEHPELIKIEGLDNSKLDPTRFFKAFLKSNNVANASIDDNSNVSSQNVNTLINEANKPLLKLLSYNKIYIEMKELFDKETADKFFQYSMEGEIYPHDSNLISFLPYSYYREETVLVKYKEVLHYISFERLFDLVEEESVILNKEDDAIAKYTDDLFIFDTKENKKDPTWTKVIRVIKKAKNTSFRFIKAKNGVSQIVTDNHPVITTEGDIEAKDITTEHKVSTICPVLSKGTLQYIYFSDLYEDKTEILLNGRPYTAENKEGFISKPHAQSTLQNKFYLTEDFGWLYGLILAEGNFSNNIVTITQNDNDILHRAENILQKLNIAYTILKKGDSNCLRLNIRSSLFADTCRKFFQYLPGQKSWEKALPSDFLKFNPDFLKGVVGGLLDGDGTLNCNSKRNISIRISSRTLLNQISFIVQQFGYTVRDYIPTEALEYEVNGCAIQQRHPLFGIAFTPCIDGVMFNSIKITNRDVQYNTAEYMQKHTNGRYSFGYGDADVANNKELLLEDEKYVYDISTETGHFVQNNIVSHNCYSYSVKEIAEKGLFFIDEMKAGRPKHLSTFNSHIIEFVAWATNQQAGAVGMPDILIYQMKFWLDDIESGRISPLNAEKDRDQSFQNIIYSLNQPFLKHGIQSAYTNFTIMDRDYFIGLFGGSSFDDGTFMVDYIEEFMLYQKAFLDYVNYERENKGFTFPVLTASCIFKDGAFQDEDMAKYVVRHNMKWGDCNIYASDNPDILSSCCRCAFDTEAIKGGDAPEEVVTKLEGNFNSIGGTDLNIGSSKVVTIDLPRVAYKAHGDFLLVKELLLDRVTIIQKFHKAHRAILQKNIDRKLLPVYTFGLMNLDKQFATIGVNGFEEYIDTLGGIDTNTIGEKHYNDKGISYAKETLDYINLLGEITAKEYGYTQNVEQIPAESCGVKMLKKDRHLYSDFPVKDKNIYSNQWCGLDSNFPMEERVRIAGVLDNLTGGGQILHANLGEAWSCFEDAWKFNVSLATAGVKYWSEIRRWHYCKNDHNFFGKKCPVCGEEPIGQICKIVGYLTKNEYFSAARKEEAENRIFYNI